MTRGENRVLPKNFMAFGFEGKNHFGLKEFQIQSL